MYLKLVELFFAMRGCAYFDTIQTLFLNRNQSAYQRDLALLWINHDYSSNDSL
jgi:hypothetical protein